MAPQVCVQMLVGICAWVPECACRQALFAMPHRAMYMLSYWSLLWNKAASYRVRKYGGKRIVVGDLVCSSPVR